MHGNLRGFKIADFPDHDDDIGLVILLEQGQSIGVIRSNDRIASDSGRNPGEMTGLAQRAKTKTLVSGSLPTWPITYRLRSKLAFQLPAATAPHRPADGPPATIRGHHA